MLWNLRHLPKEENEARMDSWITTAAGTVIQMTFSGLISEETFVDWVGSL